MVRILIVGERFYPEEFQINELALDWVSRGHEVSVLTQVPSYPAGKVYAGYRNRLYQREKWCGITIHRVRTVTGYRESLVWKLVNYAHFMLFGSLAALFLGRNSDRVFAFQTGPLTSAFPAIVIRRFFGRRLTMWTLDLWPDTVFAFGFRRRWWLVKILDAFVGFTYRSCDQIAVSCARFTERLALYKRAQTPILHAPNWSPPMKYTGPRFQLSDEPRLQVTFAGNVGLVQNLERVLSGFFSLPDTLRAQMQLNIIGDGSNRQHLQRLVHDWGGEGVVFWGHRPRDQMPMYYHASDVMLIALEDEPVFSMTVPLKFQSYLAAGKPIFAVIEGEVAEIVRQYEVGRVAAPGSVDAIRAGLEGLLTMGSSERLRLANNAQQLSENLYSRSRIFDELSRVTLS